MDLHFDDQGIGFPVIFLHAFPLDGKMWEKNSQAAVAAGYRAITIDLPGFGGSPGLLENLSDTAGDIISLANALKLNSFAICGLSMGGYIAFEIIRQAPYMVRAAILCDTTSDPDTPEKRLERMAAVENINKGGRKAYMDSLAGSLLSPATLINNRKLATGVRTAFDNASDASITAALRAMANRSSSTELLGGLLFPVLLVFGTDDPVFGAGQKMDRLLTNSELTAIKNAGHYANLEAPDEFNTALIEFLKRQSFGN